MLQAYSLSAFCTKNLSKIKVLRNLELIILAYLNIESLDISIFPLALVPDSTRV